DIVNFAYVYEREGVVIVLENRDSHGDVKEKVEIDKISGFYDKYLIHTDNSIKDVPLGQPYVAYFGWCDVHKPDVSAAPATPPPPAVPPIAPTPESKP